MENQKNNLVIVIILGSTAIKILKNVKALFESFPNTAYGWLKVIGFDGQNVDHRMCMPTVEKNLEDSKLLPHEIIRADIGDKQSRKKAENQGLLWSLPQDFHINPGAAAENAGVGGDQRIGYGLFRLNENFFRSKVGGAMRECLDWQEKNTEANMANNKFAARPVIELFVINTMAGGTGSSSYARTMTIIKQLGDELHIDVKITPLSTIVGTLNPGNKPLAAINQQSGLKNMLARLENGFTDLDQTDGDLRAISNPPVFMSNANNFGELADLERTISKIAYVLYLLMFTNFGAIARQDCVDHHNNISLDQYGTMRKGASIGLSNISFTRAKLIDFTAFDYAENLINQILTRDTGTDIERVANHLLSNLDLKETYTQTMTVNRVLSLEKSTLNAVDRVISVFRDRCGSRWGFAGCSDIMFAATYARKNELQGRILQAIEDNARQWLQSVVKTVTGEVKGYLTKINGISLSRQILEKMSESINELIEKNDKSLLAARKNEQNIKLNLKHYESIYNKLAKRFWLFRALSFADKDTIKKNYPSIVESEIRNTLQIEARILLKEIVFPQIRTLIAKLLEHISQIESNISDLGRYFSDNVTRLKNIPSYLYDAGGYELVNDKFINVNVSKFYDGLGGKETAAKKAFEQFIGHFKNLDAFVTAEHDHISKFLKDSGALNAKNFFYNLNVYDIFDQTFSTNKQKTEIISNIIEQSCLSIKITGEGDENVPKVKYICGNDRRLVDWAVKKANEIDRRGGDWKAHKDENLPEGLSFFQYRTNISIAQLMKDTSAIARLPSDSNELIRIGENPIISLMPDPESYKDGKTDSRIDTVIAQGIAAGVIIENFGNFEIHKALSEPMVIGKTIEDVRKYLARNYSSIVYICREFAKSLIADDSQTLRLLKSDKLTPTFDEKTVQNTLTTALQLIPYLKKIKKDNYGAE